MKRNTKKFSLSSVVERRSCVVKTVAILVGSYFLLFLSYQLCCCFFFFSVCVLTESSPKFVLLIFHRSDKVLTSWFLYLLNKRLYSNASDDDPSCNKTHISFALIFLLSLEKKKKKKTISISSVREWKLCRDWWTLNTVRRESENNRKCHFRINSSVNKT